MFTYKHYLDTCQKYINENYVFRNLSHVNNQEEKSIWMVHDCDSFLENALSLAKKENNINVKSTYFIRLGARAYNPFSEYYRHIITKIKKLDHDIGLHYEPSIGKSVKDSIMLFSSLFDFEIKYFNIHEPARTKIDISKIMPKKNRCYNSNYFNKIKYISDSGGRWREGCFSEHINRWDQLLVSTHPVWWYEQTPARNY